MRHFGYILWNIQIIIPNIISIFQILEEHIPNKFWMYSFLLKLNFYALIKTDLVITLCNKALKVAEHRCKQILL